MNTITVTIGIPAYNEAVTLPRLLRDIARQQTKQVQITQVMVVSDGSTDETAQIARAYTSYPVAVHEQQREGKAAAVNYIFSHATTDVVVIFDADVRLPGDMTLERLIARMKETGADLVGARVDYQKPTTYFQKILAASCDMKERMFSQMDGGDTIYTCHGRARAFSRRLYSTFHVPSSINEDAYSYVYAKEHGFSYVYAPLATVLYRLPKTMHDHIKQAVRFRASKVDHDFKTSKTAQQAYRIPLGLMMKANFTTVVQKPELLLYYIVSLYLAVAARTSRPPQQSWDVSTTSKI